MIKCNKNMTVYKKSVKKVQVPGPSRQTLLKRSKFVVEVDVAM